MTSKRIVFHTIVVNYYSSCHEQMFDDESLYIGWDSIIMNSEEKFGSKHDTNSTLRWNNLFLVLEFVVEIQIDGLFIQRFF